MNCYICNNPENIQRIKELEGKLDKIMDVVIEMENEISKGYEEFSLNSIDCNLDEIKALLEDCE